MNAIETKNLWKDYGDVHAVRDLNLTVKQGELFGLLGVNGAGKTTTIKMLCCLTAPTRGDAFVHSKSVVSQSREVKAMIGVSPQETAVASNLSVGENLALMCGIHGFSKEKTRERVAALSEQFDLTVIAKNKAGKLSGGWQRRLSLAMALIAEPSVLFLDEPSLGLDVIARSELWQVIRALKGKTTIVLTTHYMEEAQSLCDRVGVMRSGELLALGTPQELIAQSGADSFENAFISIVKEAGK